MKKVIMQLLNRTPSDRDLTQQEKAYIDSIPSQNPLGILALLAGGAGFVMGNDYLWIALFSIGFGVLTFRTFDKEKHDNPWPFYIGIFLGILGLILHLIQYSHVAVFI